MKRRIAVVLACCAVALLSACSGSSASGELPDTTETDGGSDTPITPDGTATDTPPPPPPPACPPAGFPIAKTIHRLNKAEYNNTVRDLLSDESKPADDFPADDQGYGYDNIANVLSMSPLLFEKMERAAERMIDDALKVPQAPFSVLQWDAEALTGTVGKATAVGWNLWTNGKLPTTFEATGDGVYVVSVSAYGKQAGPALTKMGLWMDTVEIVVEVAAVQDASATYKAAFDITAGTHEIAASFNNDFYDPGGAGDRNLIVHSLMVEGPYQPGTVLHMVEGEALPIGADTGDGFQKITTGDPANVSLTLKSSGTYTMQVRAYGESQDGSHPLLVGIVDGQPVTTTTEISNDLINPNTFTLEAPLTSGEHTVGFQLTNPAEDGSTAVYVDWFRILGATDLDAESNPVREALMTCSPDEMDADACTRQILGAFGRRAWRRPLTDNELDRLATLAQQARDLTQSFDEGIRMGMHALLLSPHFLYRVELDPALGTGESRALTDHELATRLSYALWSSMPDDELDTLADAGTLRTLETLDAQVRRMLLDPKAQAITENFAGQWLYLRNMDNIVRDSVLFPEFTDALAQSMRAETEGLFQSFLTTPDANMLDMVYTDSTRVDAVMADFYGLDGHSGEGAEWLTTTGTHRFGLMSHAAILSLTSHTFGTSPVNRGKWVLGQLLCMEPPPPPAEVITELVIDENQPMSMRDRLALHRADPSCAGCHNLMDPIGLGMDNFDAIGRWRTLDDFGFPVDPAGELVDGTPFSTADELASVIRDHYALPSCMVDQLFTYFLGRGVDTTDQCVLNEITDSWGESGHSLEDLIVRLLTHDVFTLRTPPDEPTTEGEVSP